MSQATGERDSVSDLGYGMIGRRKRVHSVQPQYTMPMGHFQVGAKFSTHIIHIKRSPSIGSTCVDSGTRSLREKMVARNEGRGGTEGFNL